MSSVGRSLRYLLSPIRTAWQRLFAVGAVRRLVRVLGVVSLALAAVRTYRHHGAPQLHGHAEHHFAKRVRSTPLLQQYFAPHVLVAQPLLSSVLAQYVLRGPVVHFKREQLVASDGGTIGIDWAVPLTEDPRSGGYDHDAGASAAAPAPHPSAADTAPLLMLFPGFGNTSSSSYIRRVAAAALQRGWGVGVMLFRGYGGLPVTSPAFHNLVSPQDVGLALRHAHARHPHRPLLAAGFSLGSNALVRYLGECGATVPVPLVGALSFGNPYDLNAQMQAASERPALLQRLYGIPEQRAVRFLVRAVLRHRALFAAAGVDVDAAAAAPNLRAFSQRCSCVLAGVPSVAEYYAQASCLPVLPRVAVPLVCVSALDDPVCLAAPVLPAVRRVAAASPHVVLLETQRGGHLAWLESVRGRSWLPRAVLELGEVMLQHARDPAALAVDSARAVAEAEARSTPAAAAAVVVTAAAAAGASSARE